MKSILLMFFLSTWIYRVRSSIIVLEDLAFDQSFYEDVLDPQLCERQLNYLMNDTFLAAKFLDAGPRISNRILKGNVVHIGSYTECLGINEKTKDFNIEGKYCLVNVPYNKNLITPRTMPIFTPPQELNGIFGNVPVATTLLTQLALLNNETIKHLNLRNKLLLDLQRLSANVNDFMDSNPEIPEEFMALRFSICLPKPCTTRRVLWDLTQTMKQAGITIGEDFCRLPNDKPWKTVDYVVLSVLGVVLLLSIFSSSYDIYMQVIKKENPSKVSKLYKSFSVYTNTSRLLSMDSKPSTLKCMDGIRALAMAWVVVGHVISHRLSGVLENPVDFIKWFSKPISVILSAAPITVDTFFMMSGLFVVYTSAGKFKAKQLFKNLHMFYIHRILRVYPLLVFIILLEVSIWYRIADGPYWNHMMTSRNNCLKNWWFNILLIQNYQNDEQMCLDYTWYVALDIQLYILSPLLLVFVLSKKRRASWIALIGSLLVSVALVTAYSFVRNFHSISMSPSHLHERQIYKYYYFSPLVRAPQYIIGMITGYILHLQRGKKFKIPYILVALLWLCSLGFAILYCYSSYQIMKIDFDNQLLDNVRNAFSRSMWALMMSWIVLACVNGYAGPVNWFLSLDMWKLPARVSYAVYLLHMPVLNSLIFSAKDPYYYSYSNVICDIISVATIATFLAGIAIVFIEYPFSTLIDLALDKVIASKKKKQPNPTDNETNENNQKDDSKIGNNKVTS